jgi:acetyl esterase/lipase
MIKGGYIFMKKIISISPDDLIIAMADSIVYAERYNYNNISYYQLKMSLMHPRMFFDYDKRVLQPVIVFLCGGGFTEMDRNAWAPELAWFAKQGYAVASLDYTIRTRARWPEPLIDIKEGIRFLRAHADQWGLDPNRFAIMGESAGGYLSAMAGVTGITREYDTGGYMEQSSAVQVVIPWFPPTNMASIPFTEHMIQLLPHSFKDYPDISKLVHRDAPPYMILHGTADTQVPVSEGENLYNALQAAGVESDLLILSGAEHGEAHFVQLVIKQEILNFLNKYLKK